MFFFYVKNVWCRRSSTIEMQEGMNEGRKTTKNQCQCLDSKREVDL